MRSLFTLNEVKESTLTVDLYWHKPPILTANSNKLKPLNSSFTNQASDMKINYFNSFQSPGHLLGTVIHCIAVQPIFNICFPSWFSRAAFQQIPISTNHFGNIFCTLCFTSRMDCF